MAVVIYDQYDPVHLFVCKTGSVVAIYFIYNFLALDLFCPCLELTENVAYNVILLKIGFPTTDFVNPEKIVVKKKKTILVCIYIGKSSFYNTLT